MASSLRMAAPKMASVAAQSSVKVARPAFQAAKLQHFGRAYSGEHPLTPNTPSIALRRPPSWTIR